MTLLGVGAIRRTGWPVALRHGPVVLRPLRFADVGEWGRLRRRDSKEIRRGEFRSVVPHTVSNSGAALTLLTARLLRLAGAGRVMPWAVTYGGRFVGRYALEDITAEQAENVGWIAAHMTGRGIFTTAHVLAVDYGFRQLGLRRVYSHVRTRNPASLRASEKAGFRVERTFVRREGDGVRREWRDLAIYAQDFPDGLLHRLPAPPE